MKAAAFDWQKALPQTVPVAIRPWLLDSGSLTEHLQRISGGDFTVRVLRHGWAKPRPDERAALDLRTQEACIVREVLLLCRGEPWVYARSVLPARVLRGRHRHLRSFGARSLGAHLFANTRTVRDPFEIARLPANALPAAVLADSPALLWARRSRFYLDGEPLLVAEVFLPAFQPWTTAA
ncbi:MAG TPA: chorismate lyase [Pseudomonadales bacterium]|jgi:chorismate--pyruvate lyase